PIRPSAATRPAFLAAAASPFVRSQSTASSMLPPVSFRAFLQSIMPAPVCSRSSLTSDALTAAILSHPLTCRGAQPGIRSRRPSSDGRHLFLDGRCRVVALAGGLLRRLRTFGRYRLFGGQRFAFAEIGAGRHHLLLQP